MTGDQVGFVSPQKDYQGGNQRFWCKRLVSFH